MTTRRPQITEAPRILMLRTAEGEKRITIPADAKITFGPAIPFDKGQRGYGGGRSDYALRIYKGTKENLLAVFTGVYEFRDVTMPVAKLVVREAGKSVWKSDEDGYKVETDVKREQAFVSELNLLGEAPQNGSDRL